MDALNVVTFLGLLSLVISFFITKRFEKLRK